MRKGKIDREKHEWISSEVTSHAYVQYYLLLAKVHHEKGQFEKVNEDLTAVREKRNE